MSHFRASENGSERDARSCRDLVVSVLVHMAPRKPNSGDLGAKQFAVVSPPGAGIRGQNILSKRLT